MNTWLAPRASEAKQTAASTWRYSETLSRGQTTTSSADFSGLDNGGVTIDRKGADTLVDLVSVERGESRVVSSSLDPGADVVGAGGTRISPATEERIVAESWTHRTEAYTQDGANSDTLRWSNGLTQYETVLNHHTVSVVARTRVLVDGLSTTTRTEASATYHKTHLVSDLPGTVSFEDTSHHTSEWSGETTTSEAPPTRRTATCLTGTADDVDQTVTVTEAHAIPRTFTYLARQDGTVKTLYGSSSVNWSATATAKVPATKWAPAYTLTQGQGWDTVIEMGPGELGWHITADSTGVLSDIAHTFHRTTVSPLMRTAARHSASSTVLLERWRQSLWSWESHSFLDFTSTMGAVNLSWIGPLKVLGTVVAPEMIGKAITWAGAQEPVAWDELAKQGLGTYAATRTEHSVGAMWAPNSQLVAGLNRLTTTTVTFSQAPDPRGTFTGTRTGMTTRETWDWDLRLCVATRLYESYSSSSNGPWQGGASGGTYSTSGGTSEGVSAVGADYRSSLIPKVATGMTPVWVARTPGIGWANPADNSPWPALGAKLELPGCPLPPIVRETYEVWPRNAYGNAPWRAGFDESGSSSAAAGDKTVITFTYLREHDVHVVESTKFSDGQTSTASYDCSWRVPATSSKADYNNGASWEVVDNNASMWETQRFHAGIPWEGGNTTVSFWRDNQAFTGLSYRWTIGTRVAAGGYPKLNSTVAYSSDISFTVGTPVAADPIPLVTLTTPVGFDDALLPILTFDRYPEG